MLKAPKGRIVVEADMDSKDSHTFASGQRIILRRRYNNLNRRETEPVNAKVIAAAGIPKDAEILVHHNAFHDTYKINDYRPLSGAEIASTIRHFSIPDELCYLWREPGGEWKPIPGYATGLRVFKPYQGYLSGITPKLLKDTLLITSGEYAGQAVMTVKSADYEIIFQDENDREARVIRIRHFEGEYNMREEIVAILPDLTQEIHDGKLRVGLDGEKAFIYQSECIYG